jgi:hypothetical protein
VTALLVLLLACGSALSDPGADPDPTSPVADAPALEGVAVSERAGTAASVRPLLPPARTPLYERPVEWAWWALFWLPEHWRGEAIAWILGLVTSLTGFVASKIRLRDSDPEQFGRRDPRRWIVAAFSDRPLPLQEGEGVELERMGRELSRLGSQVVKLNRALSTERAAREALEAQVRAGLLSPEARADAEESLAMLRRALGEWP